MYSTARALHHPGADPQGEAGSGYIWKLLPNDVLCGRGVQANANHGNKAFRHLVREYQVEYLACRRNEKPLISTKIMEIVRSRGGRFLRRVKVAAGYPRDRFAWVEIGDQRVYEKVCQALRDGAPQIRKQMLAMSRKPASHQEKENSANHSMGEASHRQSVHRGFSSTQTGDVNEGSREI
jgi:hypothetical protein